MSVIPFDLALIFRICLLQMRNLHIDSLMRTPEELKEELQRDHPEMRVLLDRPEDPGYETARKTFNRRFAKRPAAIAFCMSTEQVAHVVKVAKANPEYPLRVKSGGHDHEAECSKTDAIVIDFQGMKNIHFSENDSLVTVEPGLRFKDVLWRLDAKDVSIPHGTCETVGIFGFTLGGGWGPWTRLHGMCCERLVGATIVLGDGTIREISASDKDQSSLKMLWALRGGGGFSYGIVTKMVIKTFQQPADTLRFAFTWDQNVLGEKMPAAIKILDAWEQVIKEDVNPQLMGTNLQIMAIPEDDLSVENSIHDCTFYGYYAGLEEGLRKDLLEWFGPFLEEQLEVKPTHKNQPPKVQKVLSSQQSFSHWDRVSTAKKIAVQEETELLPGYMPPDIDYPAPHKISSRLVQEGGLGRKGQESLIRSLRSRLISQDGIDAHLHTYVTLGAISGRFYGEEYDYPDFPAGSSFPFKKRPYTIQYQAWWDETEEDKQAGKTYQVKTYANQALDWISECSTRHFPQTSGSFISFKDSSIPTHQYFMESYEQLKQIKKTYSRDLNNIFSSRKTIL